MRRSLAAIAAVLGTLACSAVSAAAQTPTNAPREWRAPATEPAPATAAPTAATTAVASTPAPTLDALRPGDLLRIRVWREPDFSGDYVINERGDVTLPRLGATPVAGRPMREVEGTVTTAYRRFLLNPTIEVVPLRRIAVLGAVAHPGTYPVDPTMTLADVLALAGGATPGGKPHAAEIRRGSERLRAELAPVGPFGTLPLRSGDQVVVPERAWLARNAVVVPAIASSLVTIIVATVRR